MHQNAVIPQPRRAAPAGHSGTVAATSAALDLRLDWIGTLGKSSCPLETVWRDPLLTLGIAGVYLIWSNKGDHASMLYVGNGRDIGALLQLSRDGKASARIESARALQALGDPRATDRLRRMLRDSSAGVRDAAFTALGRLDAAGPLELVAAGLDVEHEGELLVALIDGIGIQAMFEPARFDRRRQRLLLDTHLARLFSATA